MGPPWSDVSCLSSPLPPFPPFPPSFVHFFLRELGISKGMQKFALLFLAASTSFLGFLAPVEGQAVAKRETNGERFARGMGPLPPTKRSIYGTSERSFLSSEC